MEGMEGFRVLGLRILALGWLLLGILGGFGVEERGFRMKKMGFVCLNAIF